MNLTVGTTLRDFVATDSVVGAHSVHEVTGHIADELATRARGIPGPSERAVAERALQILDIPVVDLCRRAWGKWKEIEQFRDEEKYPPHETFEVFLVEHGVSSSHDATLTVRVSEVITFDVDGTLDASLNLDGVCLGIRAGRIRTIGAGTGSVSLSLVLGGISILDLPDKEFTISEPVVLETEDTQPRALPGVERRRN